MPPHQANGADFWRRLESATSASFSYAELWSELRFNTQGLLPVIAQCAESKTVLMQAWANIDAIQLSLSSGQMHYYSRSRARIWRKGESSGNTQRLVELRADCDGDSLLALVEQRGPACHTLRHSCFYWLLGPKQIDLEPCGK